MQTFLPYPNFIKTAKCLDWRRLGKQRVECLQILKALNEGGGWSNHPATKMWKGYVPALQLYANVIIQEWIDRGYNNTMFIPFDWESEDLPPIPAWLGDERLHSSHRGNLLRKDPDWYGQFGWTESPEIPYFWPTVSDD